MPANLPGQEEFEDPKTRAFYQQVLITLAKSQIPFLIGGTYAFERYTGIARYTKDLDLFVRSSDCNRLLEVLSSAGYKTELSSSHWLAKVFSEEDFIDVIFNSSNGIHEVDDTWFERAVPEVVVDVRVPICPPEEIMWQKATMMDRDRFDGADVIHLLRACAENLDWSRLLRRFGVYWRVLLSHLILFGFVYPAERARIPDWVMQELLSRLQQEINNPPPTDRLCQGTLLSGTQYLVDIEHWGYRDARLLPRGNMTAEEIAAWTGALAE